MKWDAFDEAALVDVDADELGARCSLDHLSAQCPAAARRPVTAATQRSPALATPGESAVSDSRQFVRFDRSASEHIRSRRGPRRPVPNAGTRRTERKRERRSIAAGPAPRGRPLRTLAAFRAGRRRSFPARRHRSLANSTSYRRAHRLKLKPSSRSTSAIFQHRPGRAHGRDRIEKEPLPARQAARRSRASLEPVPPCKAHPKTRTGPARG